MPTLTEHIYVSILDKRIFYAEIRWLISERDVSTIAMQTGETSFHLHCLIESLSNLYKCTDYEVKTHLIFFFLKTNKTATFVIVLDFIAFKLLSDTLSEIVYVYLFILTGFSHPHSPPGLDSAPCSEELPFLKLWGCGVSPLWSIFHRPGDFGSFRHFQTWTNFQTMLFQKDIGVDFLGTFKG